MGDCAWTRAGRLSHSNGFEYQASLGAQKGRDARFYDLPFIVDKIVVVSLEGLGPDVSVTGSTKLGIVFPGHGPGCVGDSGRYYPDV